MTFHPFPWNGAFWRFLPLILAVVEGLCYGHSGLFRPFLFESRCAFLPIVDGVGKFLFIAAFSSSLAVLSAARGAVSVGCCNSRTIGSHPFVRHAFPNGVRIDTVGHCALFLLVLLPPVLVCLLVTQIWAGIRAVERKVRARSFPVTRRGAFSGISSRALGPEASAQAVALRAADRRPQSKNQKGKLSSSAAGASASSGSAARRRRPVRSCLEREARRGWDRLRVDPAPPPSGYWSSGAGFSLSLR